MAVPGISPGQIDKIRGIFRTSLWYCLRLFQEIRGTRSTSGCFPTGTAPGFRATIILQFLRNFPCRLPAFASDLAMTIYPPVAKYEASLDGP